MWGGGVEKACREISFPHWVKGRKIFPTVELPMCKTNRRRFLWFLQEYMAVWGKRKMRGKDLTFLGPLGRNFRF